MGTKPTPEETLIAEALKEAGIVFERDIKNLDFFLPDYGVFIESKGGQAKAGTQQAEKLVKQLARDPNIILIQGYKATKAFVSIITRTTRFQPAPYFKEHCDGCTKDCSRAACPMRHLAA